MHTPRDSTVLIQSTSQPQPSTPGWFGEVVIIARHLQQTGVLAPIPERIRFARRRCGRSEMIDVLAVLCGSALSGERTLEAFDQHLRPCAVAFLALFGRDHLPARSTRSRCCAALTTEPVASLRRLFLDDLLSRRAACEQQPCGLIDRAGTRWKVFDIDGTREAASPRALPMREDLPAAQRRLDEVCAAGSIGRTRGDVVRTRRTVLQAHSSQWLMICGIENNCHISPIMWL